MTELLQKKGLSKLLFEKMKSRLLWHSVLAIAIFFHIFTWSFPSPSSAEAEKYLDGLTGEASESGWIILTRTIDAIFSFGYAKFAFVLLGLACILALYCILTRLADEYLAIAGAVIFSSNSFLFTNIHRTQPEVVIALIFLTCVYLYVRFTTYWHTDVNKSASATTYGVVILAFCMLLTDLRSTCLIPSLALMIFFVQVRIYKPIHALISTLTLSAALGVIGWLVLPDGDAHLRNIISPLVQAPFDESFITKLQATYTDGYASPLWHNLYKSIDFLRLKDAPHRRLEMYILIIVSAALMGLFVVRIGRLISHQRAKVDIMTMMYSPHIPLILICNVAFLLATASQVRAGGSSSIYLFLQVFILILLCLSIYAFFLRAARGNVHIASEPRWSELVYRPIVAVAGTATCTLSLINAYFYVMPYRGSNYPTLYDALQRHWEATGCSQLAYAPPLYTVALASRQTPPAKGIDKLYADLADGTPLAEGCIVLPLIAKDGVYSYAPAAARLSKPIDQVLAADYTPATQISLPFYQKDPAYPMTAIIEKNPYKHAHGDSAYGFGGMEEITIYRRSSSGTN